MKLITLTIALWRLTQSRRQSDFYSEYVVYFASHALVLAMFTVCCGLFVLQCLSHAPAYLVLLNLTFALVSAAVTYASLRSTERFIADRT